MSHLTEFPLARPAGCPFDPPAALTELRAEEPVARMTYPGGHEGWVVTGFAEARAVLADQRFSSRQELLRLPYPLPGLEELTEMPPAAVGDMTGIDAPEHTRFRKLLVGSFTVRRMRQLTERVAEVTAEHLAAMRELGPEVDLVAAFAHPVPAVMICELLGVPYADRDTFQRHVTLLFSADAPAQERFAGITRLQEYVAELVAAKRSAPTDDLFSDLTASDLTDEELAGVGSFLLAAGLDTTANQIALGAYALLRHPEQIPLLLADPDRGVEELLRYLTITHTGVRTALEDVELGGQVIRAGETVTLSTQAANRDPLRFDNPDELDLTRTAIGHLTFGHGIHQCLGQQLARVEMRVAMPALFTAFPTLRLAGEATLRPDHQNIYGVQSLPVSWEETR
ncbi:cytochrome P450 [Kutzneria sp. 744]|uniref:cytochrome P450 n=1 Tax=Kutzneria sp. (strain 744) TaxID=345341 RepID=UPI0003EEADE1|nr:cytochrome P450 [Kutzneria sp. 744]EWM14911.1 cytochrome P450 CYP105 [Kutzneria sp. 744]